MCLKLWVILVNDDLPFHITFYSLDRGRVQKVPWMVGMTELEGLCILRNVVFPVTVL